MSIDLIILCQFHLRHSIFLMVKEAFNNTVKHAGGWGAECREESGTVLCSVHIHWVELT